VTIAVSLITPPRPEKTWSPRLLPHTRLARRSACMRARRLALVLAATLILNLLFW